MTEPTNPNLVGEHQLRSLIDQLSDQMCQAVDGQFDFAVRIEVQDETIEKLQMLINFVLDAARRSLMDIEAKAHDLDVKTQTLSAVNMELENEITERKQAEADREQMHKQLLSASRQAGMAEVATGVLHNVGNVLNSVNVTATLVTAMVQESKAPDLLEISRLLQQHTDDLGLFITSDDKGRLIPAYLTELGGHLVDEQGTMLDELQALTKNIEHIKEIVSMQQSYAKVSGVEESLSLAYLVEDALQINSAGLNRHGAKVVRQFRAIPDVIVDKQKVLQILVNLISNAKYALTTAGLDDKILTVRIVEGDDPPEHLRIDIIDNGIGIPLENLTRIFSHGFTTKTDGHGFGLHSCALAAQSIGGSLTVHSDGPNLGAVFSLHIPLKVAEVSR